MITRTRSAKSTADRGTWCSLRVAADMSGLSQNEVRGLILDGRVGACQIGGKPFVSLTDVRTIAACPK